MESRQVGKGSRAGEAWCHQRSLVAGWKRKLPPNSTSGSQTPA
ncbi:MAG: hypothetical protein Q4D51_12585 [Eubacteriales bacterium]|nr:hypothetical protein [Eubacteriales bacterium]